MLINNINIKYDGKTIYDNFSINIKDNKINCIIGPSGCGKTTLLNYISNFLVENNVNVSYVFQEDRLLPWKNLFDNLKLIGQKYFKGNILLEKINNILTYTNLLDYKEYYPDELSGGMKQKVNIARALLCESEVLILDEPFKSLDVKNKDNIIKLIKEIYKKNKITIIFVTHDKGEVKSLADNIILLGENPVKIICTGDKNSCEIVFNNLLK